ncbi:MAG: manganese efflux pump, partial [Chroococcales cyanobacterium]
MNLTKLLILGVVIGSNNLAAALALGVLGQAKQRWRVVFVFGLFEFFIPLVGIWLGKQLSNWIASNLEWLGSLLLLGLGLWSIYTGMRHRSAGEELAEKATTWTGLFLLATGLSLDNLIVGFSLGLRNINALVVATTIALFS